MKPIQVGLLGIGTVGSGTFKVLTRNQAEIRRRAGRGIEIAMVADLDTARAKSIVGDGVEVGHHRDANVAAGAAPDLLAVAAQHLEGAAADGADAEQADLDRLDVAGNGCGAHSECRLR